MKTNNAHFKEPVIYKGDKQWYVYYRVIDPNTGQYKMFKDRGGLNYIKNIKDREREAEVLREAYLERLKAGWSPFGNVPGADEEETPASLRQKPMTSVFFRFIEMKRKVLDNQTIRAYLYVLRKFEMWLKTESKYYTGAPYFSAIQAQQYADHLYKRGLSGKTINNQIKTMGTLFIMAIDRGIADSNPFAKISALPENDGSNYPFTEAQKQQLKEYILEHDPALWRVVKFVYHTFIRPVELTRLRVSHIDLRTWQIIVHSKLAKNKKQMAVDIPESFRDEILAMGLQDMPADWFLFSKGLQPGAKQLRRIEFTKRHSKVLRACNMGPEHSLYGWKHTGNIDSYVAGIDILELMKQNRHQSLEQTMTYLRGLGLRPQTGFSVKAPSL